ncbi:MAG: response regulator transcription factor [Devosiaceae bacterium]|nr:response regulator transcription factor [Devosiaceae bacterium]
MSEHILVVDDDSQITSFLKRYLEKQGFSTTCVGTGREMKQVLDKQKIDLCVLDVGLPDANGFELTQEIRRTSNLPIIVLSARDEAFDRIFGLEFGADDYVTKPFEPREFVARIRSVLRRSKLEGLAKKTIQSEQSLLQFGHWVMNLSERTLTHFDNGKDANLTSMEFDLLRVLVEQPRMVLSRDQLLDGARGFNSIVGDRTIDVHIMRLRKKIEPDPNQPRFIKTIHGIGYCLSDNVTRFENPTKT